ncbi:MAG: peptidoglycan editing factor PgeF [Acidaminococcaceae bacterium]
MAEFLLRESNGIWYGFFPMLEKLGFTHGFTCRLHGNSDLSVGGLNMALHVGDAQQKVVQNRKTVADALSIDAKRITTCEQIHGSNTAVVTTRKIGSGAFDFSDTIAGTDALITREKAVPLMLFFADCVPVIFADPITGAVGVAHAGWRGSVAGIGAKTVRRMVEEFGCVPENLLAAIGPSIGPCCYEVDEAVYEQAKEFDACFSPVSPGHWQLNLWKMNEVQLLQEGLKAENITCANICTADNKELFFSYRAERGKTGRLAAVICSK